MDFFAAIDLRDGKCVRLHQGDYARETIYGDDPVAQAQSFADSGADWIHVVDLDAARTGVSTNRDAVAAIARAVDVPVQTGGGVRSIAAAHSLFAAGVERVVIGTAALTNPELVEELARSHRVAVGLDARAGEVATDGWTVGSARRVVDVAESFAGVGVDAFVVTDIARDGTLGGPDLVGLRAAVAATPVAVVASGGVAGPNDLRELRSLEADGRMLAGVIAGKALYENRLDVAEAVAILRECR